MMGRFPQPGSAQFFQVDWGLLPAKILLIKRYVFFEENFSSMTPLQKPLNLSIDRRNFLDQKGPIYPITRLSFSPHLGIQNLP